jgi:HNH endonuclease
MQALIAIVIAIALVGLVVKTLLHLWPVILAACLIALAAKFLPRVIRHILKERYFASDEFLAHKNEIAAVVAEHNEVASYVAEIRDRGSFRLGASSTGTQAYLASFQNTSYHNYRRDRNEAHYQAPNVHNCSLQVVRNASADPVKYVMKYFNVKSDEANLADVENLGEDITRLENAVNNLEQREASITKSFNPPAFILKYYADEFMKHIGVELSPISVPYPTYIFEYVSAGGNSSQRTTVTLHTPTIDALIETLSQKIRFRKSAAGQRALMTSTLRNLIKTRDNHTCRYCSVSLAAEPHLLLEVDHVIPLSKGGLSTLENLQTLCWRCNRTKSNKVASATPTPTGETKKVRCFNCQHVQQVPVSVSSYECEECGQRLKRKTAS